jgi:hypothetical protein
LVPVPKSKNIKIFNVKNSKKLFQGKKEENYNGLIMLKTIESSLFFISKIILKFL